MNELIRAFLTALAVCAASFHAHAQQQTPIEGGSATIMKKDKTGKPVSATVRTTVTPADFPFTTGYRWGAELKRPRSIVTAVELKVDGVDIFVPLSSYGDLANASSVRLDAKRKPYRLSIHGGDASVAYEAQLSFDASFVVRRRVFNKSFPEVAWEETRYRYNTNDR